MKYFSYISHSYVPKNELQKKVGLFLIENNRIVIDAAELPVFQQSITDTIAKINKEHPR